MKERERSAGADKIEQIARGQSDAAGRGQSDAAGRGQSDAASARREEGAQAQREEAERAAAAARVEAARERKEASAARAARAAEEEAARRMRAAGRKEERAERRRSRREGRSGFGGWLAAVVSLSVAVLALGAILTVGYFDLDEARAQLTDGYRRAAYELAERVEALDTSLAKARVAEGAALQRALTEVLVQCELAERDLESIPVDGVDAAPLAAFFGRTAGSSRRLLGKLAAGRALSAEEEAEVERLYGRAEELREGAATLSEGAAAVGAEAFGAQSRFREGFDALSRIAAEGERPQPPFGPQPQGKGASEGERPQPPFGPQPQGKGASEGERPQPPFGPHPQGKGASEGSLLAAAPALSEREIGERAQSLFASYGCKDAAVVGRAERRGVACFEVEFSDGEGRPYTALLTERGGYLAFLDGHEGCSRLLFDRDACVEAARKFLDGCGYAGLVSVWATEGGSECRVEFVPEEEGVLLYTDRVMVKVCRGRGEVTGLDARLYLRCHKERAFAEPAVARETVEANAARRMDLLGVRAALIPRAGRELLCWEVRGTAGGRLYYAYVDAATGETAEIRTVCADGMLH